MEGQEFRDAWPRIVTDELVKEYENDVAQMERAVQATATEWKTVAAMYGENADVVKPEQLLADIASFVSAFNAVRKELTMTSATASSSSSHHATAAVKRLEEKVDTVDAVASNDVDELKSQLASGQAFEARREQRRVARGQTIRGKGAF